MKAASSRTTWAGTSPLMIRSKMHSAVSTRLRSVSDMAEIPLGSAPPETVLPSLLREAEEALAEAIVRHPLPLAACIAVAARWPRYMAAWATLSEQSEDP